VTKTSIVPLLRAPKRPSPSGRGPEEFLRLFVKHKPAVYRNLHLFGMNFSQLSFPLLYARCRAGYRAEERAEFLLVTNRRRHYLLPLIEDWQAFVGAAVELAREGGRVMAFPEVAAMPHRRGRYPEYECETEFLATMPGRKLKTYRRDARNLEAAGVRVEEGPWPADEMLGMNSRWYADFEARKGFRAERFAESEAVIALAGLGLDDKDLVRVFRAVIRGGATREGRARAPAEFCGFLITCRLSETYWAAVLLRSLSEHSGVGHYLWHKAAQVYLAEGVPMENDSTSGSDPALSAYKRRFSSGLIYPYEFWANWLSRFL
jgi:hypothetical protein